MSEKYITFFTEKCLEKIEQNCCIEKCLGSQSHFSEKIVQILRKMSEKSINFYKNVLKKNNGTFSSENVRPTF